MATYDFSVADFGGARTWTVTARGGSVGSLVGATFSVRVVNPSGVEETWTDGFTGLAASQVQFITPDSTYWDEVGGWTLHLRYTLGTVTETLDPISVRVGPSGGTSSGAVAGATSVTGLNAQIAALSALASEDAPRIIRMPSGGTLTLGASEYVVGASNVWIEAPDDFTVDCTARAGVAPYDDATVCAVLVSGAFGTDEIDTDLDGAHYPGDRTIAVMDQGTIDAGDWIYIESASSSLLYKEMHYVESAAANVITTRTGLRLVQPDTATVTQVDPVRNFRWTGGRFTASGGTCGAAFLFRGAEGCRVDSVRFRGFTRAAIMLDRATTGFGSYGCHTLGECNSGLYAECAHDVTVQRWTTSPYASTYQHASGYARHHMIASHGVTGFTVEQCSFQHVAGGVRLHSGSSHRVVSCTFKDLDPTRLIADGVTADDLDGSSDPIGIAICGSYATVPKADWVDGVVIIGCNAEDIFTPNGSCAFELHDWRSTTIDNIALINDGVDPNVRRMVGFRVDDILTGHIRGLQTRGIERALSIFKTPTNISIEDCDFNGTHPAGSATYAIWVDMTASAFSMGMIMRRVTFGNFNVPWTFGATHPGDLYSEIVDCKGSWNVPRARQFYNASGASIPAGAPAIAAAGGTFRRVTAAGAQARSVLVATEAVANNAYGWFSDLTETSFVRITGTVNYNDRLETDGAGGFVASALVDDERAKKVAVETHAGAGYVASYARNS